jgi:DNA polymerase-4
VGLVASVGIAPNKYLAKLASDLEKPDGFVVIRQEEAQGRLAPLPVGRLWGIGKVSQKKLKGLGIETIGDLLRMPMDGLESQFGVHARRLKGLGMGVDDRRVVPRWDAKSLSAETTFANDISNDEELRDVVDSLADKVARRVRKGGYLAYTIQLKARYADFTTVTRAHTVGEATAETAVIRDAARVLLEEKLDRRGRALRLLGVGVSHIVRVEETQSLLFEDEQSRKNKALDGVMDSLQDKFGSDVIHRGKRRRRDGLD